MVSEAASKPTKAKVSRLKVRTGCGTCKIRHIKCDEKKPICEKCSTTGRVCDGYEVPSNHRFLSRISQARDRDATAALIRSHTYILPKLAESIKFTQTSWNAFHSFQDSTSLQLSTAIPTSLWSGLVLQISETDEAIRQGLLALGAMTQRFQLHPVQTTMVEQARILEDEARQHYLSGINHLRGRLSSKPGEERSLITLLPCLLFVFYEFLQGDEHGAIAHLRSGLAIERDILSRRSPSIPSSEIDTQIWIMLRILEMALSIWLDIDPRLLKPNGPLFFAMLAREVQDDNTHDEIDEAGERWNKLMYNIHTLRAHYAGGIPSPVERENQKALQTSLEDLDQHLRSLKARSTDSPGAESKLRQRRIDVTLVNVRMAQLSIGAALTTDRAGHFATRTAGFLDIVERATPLLRPVNLATSSSLLYSVRHAQPALKARGLMPLFWFAGGLIQPLFFTAGNCQDMGIAERAVELLLVEKGWREGAWDSVAMARIARNRLRERGISMKSVEWALAEI